MTICIAAIAENKSILAVSDKKLTSNLGVTSGYQISENKKIVEINPNCIALFAGHIVNANDVLAIAKKSIKSTDTVSDVAEKIKLAYVQKFRNAVNDEILGKYNLDIDQFNAQQRTLETTFVNSVLETINAPTTNLGIEIIVAGIDQEGPKVFKVLHPGSVSNETPLGYACVGSGSSHANLSLIESQYHPGTNTEALVYSIVKAKKKAEYDPNVGDMSTMVSINDAGIKWIENEDLKNIFKEYDKSVSEVTEITKKSSKIMKEVIYGPAVRKKG